MLGIIQSENGKNVNFRRQPNKTASAPYSLPVGTKVTVLDTDTDGWVHAEYSGTKGYIMAQFVDIEQTADDAQSNVHAADPDLMQRIAALENRVDDLTVRMDRIEDEWANKMGWG